MYNFTGDKDFLVCYNLNKDQCQINLYFCDKEKDYSLPNNEHNIKYVEDIIYNEYLDAKIHIYPVLKQDLKRRLIDSTIYSTLTISTIALSSNKVLPIFCGFLTFNQLFFAYHQNRNVKLFREIDYCYNNRVLIEDIVNSNTDLGNLSTDAQRTLEEDKTFTLNSCDLFTRKDYKILRKMINDKKGE